MNAVNSEPDMIILCGGLGTRLRSVFPETPKALVPFGKETLVDILLKYFLTFGLKRFIFSTGHGGDQIRRHMEEKYGPNAGFEYLFSHEPQPLGTGGALKQAFALVQNFPCLVANGDSFFPVNIKEFLSFHTSKKSLLTIALASRMRDDGGKVLLDENGDITGFHEKTSAVTARFMSGGMYVCERDAFSRMADREIFSLEYDFFPTMTGKGICFGYPTEAEVVDIGTPERYAAAQHILPSLV